MKAKICGISEEKTLRFILNHINPIDYIGFICNYPKSKRFVEIEVLRHLTNINKRNSKFVAVLVNPSKEILEKIKNLNFDFYQLYDVTPDRTKEIKNTYKKKIITALTIKDKRDVDRYKDYLDISDIFLFDGKGYEKSIGFDHSLLKNLPKNIVKMIAGDIKHDDKLHNFLKIVDIIDLSGSLETNGKKDFKKIDIFLKNLKELNDKN